VSVHLAIDTATDLGSVAVGVPGDVKAEVVFSERRHASVLTPAIEAVLRLAGVSYAHLTGIVVADGPGSFTGLRIGFAAAQGIIAGHEDIQLSTVSSLVSAAWPTLRILQEPVAALYDAYRGEVFAGVFELAQGRVRPLVSPMCGSIDDVISDSPVAPACAVGEGALLYADRVRGWTGRDPVGPPQGSPRAATLLELLGLKGIVTPVGDPDAFEPHYGRRAAAQDRWEEKHGRPLHDPPSN
jgi:tRNA threonylcarbamoyladenosine biosynthesis protein TsaB